MGEECKGLNNQKIYITGDCHGEYGRFSSTVFPEQKAMTRNDFVIVAGDFGYWDDSPQQRYWRKWLEQKPFSVLFVDGNHENFDMLSALPKEAWHGGMVHRAGENILHLMRGQVYDIGGYKWFTMGGAQSHDIQDGILDPNDPNFHQKYRAMLKKGAFFRVLGKSWWPQELPSDEEYACAEKTLKENGYRVDFVLSHEAPTSDMWKLGNGSYQENKLSDFLEQVKRTTSYRAWFHGHYHKNYRREKMIGLYRKIISLDDVIALENAVEGEN